MQTEETKQNKMGTAPVLPLIFSMALPAMFSMLVQALYNIVDSFFVAQVSEKALAAVSLAFPLQNLLIAFAVGTAVGVTSLISRRLGEGRQEEANSAATHGILLALCTWVLFALYGAFFSTPFFRLFETDPEIIQMGSSYISICCVFSFGVFVEVTLEKTLQATGNMIWPMIFQLIGAVTNMILDPIMIFGLLGLPAMGVAGAAIATVTGQILAMVVSSLVITFRDHDIQISFRHFRPNPKIIKDIYIVGVPSIVMQSIGTVMTMALNGILSSFSTTAYTVFGLYFKLQSFVFMPVFGLNQGLLPILGYNYGARNKHRMMSAFRSGCIIALAIMAVGMVVFLAVPPVAAGHLQRLRRAAGPGHPRFADHLHLLPLRRFGHCVLHVVPGGGPGHLQLGGLPDAPAGGAGARGLAAGQGHPAGVLRLVGFPHCRVLLPGGEPGVLPPAVQPGDQTPGNRKTTLRPLGPALREKSAAA